MTWRDWFNSGPYLVQISPQRLKITNLSNNRVWEDAPLVAIAEDAKGNKSIIAIGSAAKGKADLVVNPFDHPRTFLHDFTVAESLIKYALRSMMPRHLFTVSPVIIMQVTEALEGGMTQIEHRALRELAIGAGARKAYIYEKPTPPTLAELQEMTKL